MTFKTILIQLNNPGRAEALIEVASSLATRWNSHLIGLHALPARKNAPKVAPSAETVTETIRKTFTEMTARQQFVSEWRSINSEAHDPSAVVLDHGRACDLIVASQTDPTWEGSRHLDFPERLAIESGRPVLVVPASGRFPGMPQRIMIAWNNRREAARAVFDALPLLQAGEAVTLLTVDDAKGRTGALPDTEIAACLARHGIRLTASRVAAEEWTVGEEIRVRAADMRADLVVMGAYGHSRFREYAFGGVTRHMSGNMTIPILLSH